MLIDEKQYIVIHGWMIANLGLKGNELLIYAIIYGFSQDSESEFHGSLRYLESWTNSTKQGVIKCLKSLMDKQLISRHEIIVDGKKSFAYWSTKFTSKQSLPVNKVYPIGKQSLPIQVNKVYPTGKQSLPNNIDNNIDNIIDDNIEICANAQNRAPKTTKSKKFVKPTLEEVETYCKERRNTVNAKRFIDYYTANGWKVGKNPMKDWKAAVRTWENNGYNQNGVNNNAAVENDHAPVKYDEFGGYWDKNGNYYV